MGSVETILAERVVHLGWRLRRAERLEGAALDLLEAQQVTKSASSRAKGGTRREGEGQADEESLLTRMIVEDFGDSKLLDQLLGYERRIENSLYRTMNELRKQRILREVERSEFRLQAGQESVASAVTRPPEGRTRNTRVNAELQTVAGPLSLPTSTRVLEASEETPYGVTTNGAQSRDQLCQTNPIGADRLPEQTPSDATAEEIGRGRGPQVRYFALGGPARRKPAASLRTGQSPQGHR